MNAKVNRSGDRLQKMRSPASRWLWILGYLWVVVLCIGAFWWRLGSVGLVDETEPLFAEAARQMSLTGDWITPYFNGQTRFDKPPLIYWLMAIAYQAIGVNAWAVRLPSALSATGLAIGGFYLLRRFGFPRASEPAKPQRAEPILRQESKPAARWQDRYPDKTYPDKTYPDKTNKMLWFSAWIGATLMVLNLQTLAWARTGVSDMLLSSCISGALFAFFLGYAQPQQSTTQTGWYLMFYGLTALAVLAKGPVGIVLPGLIIALFLLYVGQVWQVLRQIKLAEGMLLFLLLTVPWYVLVIQANGQAYIDNFFGYHNLQRFTQVVNRHWGPWYFYFIVVPICFFPWSAYLPVAIARLKFWRVQAWRQQPRSHHLGIFALVWFVVIFGFFTISNTKLPSYTLPLLPPAGILVGMFWSEQMVMPSKPGWGVRASHLAQIILCLGLAIACLFVPSLVSQEPELPGLVAFLQQSAILPLAIVIWLSVAIASFILWVRRRSPWIWVAALTGFIAFLTWVLMPTLTFVDVQRQLPLRQIATTLTQVKQPNEPIAMIGPGKPSLVFYSHERVTFIARPSQVPEQLRRLARRRQPKNSQGQNSQGQNSQGQNSRRPTSILVIGRDRKLIEAGLTRDRYQVLQTAGQYKLVRLKVKSMTGSGDRQKQSP